MVPSRSHVALKIVTAVIDGEKKQVASRFELEGDLDWQIVHVEDN